MVKTAAVVVGVLALLVMAVLSGRRRNKRLKSLVQAEVAQFEEEQGALVGAGRKELTSGAPVKELPEIVRDERQREIAALVEKQPEEVALLLRAWLADRRT